MVQTLKSLLLWNQKADDLETWYASLGARVLPSLLNDDPGWTLTCFTARSNLVPYGFVWEKGKTMDFFRNYCGPGTRVLPMFSYDDPGLTLTIFMTGSDLFLNAYAWVKAYTALSANVFPSLIKFSISSTRR